MAGGALADARPVRGTFFALADDAVGAAAAPAAADSGVTDGLLHTPLPARADAAFAAADARPARGICCAFAHDAARAAAAFAAADAYLVRGTFGAFADDAAGSARERPRNRSLRPSRCRCANYGSARERQRSRSLRLSRRRLFYTPV